ncbi:MAG TPA: hypothetical protein VNR65_07305 [Geobacterales bacterium]|nr:hypothetical protein [Geobacterales bacterium]
MKSGKKWGGGMKRAMIALGLAGLLAGCSTGSSGVENAALLNQPLKGNTARVKIVRAETFAAALRGARLKLDGKQIADIGDGAATVLDIPAGAHEFTVDVWDHPNVYKINVNAKPGMLYEMEVQPRSDAIVAGMFGVVGMAAEASANPNGGVFEIRVARESRVAS